MRLAAGRAERFVDWFFTISWVIVMLVAVGMIIWSAVRWMISNHNAIAPAASLVQSADRVGRLASLETGGQKTRELMCEKSRNSRPYFEMGGPVGC